MWSSNPTPCLVLFFLLISLDVLLASSTKKSYIVYLGSHSHDRLYATHEAHTRRVEESHVEFLRSYLGSYKKARKAIFASYKREINGFAAYLDGHEAAEIAKNSQVVSVFLNKAKELHTTHSWDFMLVEKDGVAQPSSVWEKANYGESVIIGSIDSGVWPESKSFNDEGYGPVPSQWKGACQNENDPEFRCNRKLIGAKYFSQGYESRHELNLTMKSPRDFVGHGSATLSVAGGNFVRGVGLFGMANETMKGGSPRARLAAYKACWNNRECYDADLLGAFNAAILDGVDVISVSIGQTQPSEYMDDSISIGAFHAAKKGILVVCAAGNYGPKPGSAINVSPWILTVAASTTDREFRNFVELRGTTGGVQLKGASLSGSLPEHKFYPLITGTDAQASNALADEAMVCKPSTLDPVKVEGKILVCIRSGVDTIVAGQEALDAGATGMVLCNDVSNGNEITADPHVLPASHISYSDGVTLFAYMNSTTDPLAYITTPSMEFNTKPAPFMAASFSSVGPNMITPAILKPDVTAPGVNIIAASTGLSKLPYSVTSGTSMSCPHVSGVAALVKAVHPDWSPAAIKSAIMTTARTRDNMAKPMGDAFGNKATPFNYGSGHLRPNRAVDPGLVYDINSNGYHNFLCTLGYPKEKLDLFWNDSYKCPGSASVLDLNYPSITVPELSNSITLHRSLTNVGSPSTYEAQIRQPPGVTVRVYPSKLKFVRVGETRNFAITLEVSRSIVRSDPKKYVFGGLKWSNGKHHVRSPIVVGFGSQ